MSFVGPETKGNWVRTQNGAGTKKATYLVSRNRAMQGLDAGQGQDAASDGSVKMPDNAGLKEAVKSHSATRGGLNEAQRPSR